MLNACDWARNDSGFEPPYCVDGKISTSVASRAVFGALDFARLYVDDTVTPMLCHRCVRWYVTAQSPSPGAVNVAVTVCCTSYDAM